MTNSCPTKTRSISTMRHSLDRLVRIRSITRIHGYQHELGDYQQLSIWLSLISINWGMWLSTIMNMIILISWLSTHSSWLSTVIHNHSINYVDYHGETVYLATMNYIIKHYEGLFIHHNHGRPPPSTSTINHYDNLFPINHWHPWLFKQR